MRSGEMLLCVANAVGLIALFVPGTGRLHRMRFLSLMPPLTAIAQVSLEGYRWQLIPAYVLATALGLGCGVRLAPSTKGPRWGWVAAAIMGVVVSAVSVAVPFLVPVFRFPEPGGPYAIGTVTYHWHDDDRREIFDPDPGARRELMAQIWYPAEPWHTGPGEPYVPDAEALAPIAGRLLGVPGFVFDYWDRVPTHATRMAPVASARGEYPVLVYASGLNAFRQSNLFQIEQLVSRGFVVVGLDQPYTSAATVFPDGRTVPGWPKDRLVDVIQQSITPTTPAPELGDTELSGGLLPYLAQDLGFALDQLTRLNTADPHGLFTGRLDLDRAGAFGVSLGAMTVGQACHADPRLRACLMMDAAMPAEVVHSGLRQPAMWLTRDADSILRERGSSGGWPEHEIRETIDTQRETFGKSPEGAGYHIEIPGMFHVNYTDAPRWTPLARMLGLAGPIDAARGHEILATYCTGFFERHLAGKDVPLLDSAPPWTGVRIERR
ncbi:alpha/beta hydrolase family protein [Mycolicibacterium tusciae]|uniref:alpha/beta hydrolase family protein n=1 Tax=Mycolicibacterium tusciae TaxID=75922 RepID=UPI00024A2D66|nr:hypothetical protein [Mycolicibacterium tusciae]